MAIVFSVEQSAATDGAGPGPATSAVSLLWAVSSLVLGAPLTLVGMKLSRWGIPQGMGIALSGGVLVWASLVNSVPAPGISDIILMVVVGAIMGVGLALGLFPFMRTGGMAMLSLCGGLSIGLRMALLKKNFLIPIVPVNWVIACVFALAAGFLVVWRTRAGHLLGMTATGTFLVALAIDLMLHGAKGVSVGLRLLFDHNQSHASALYNLKYNPTLSTQVTLGVSLGLIPILAYTQHRLFPEREMHAPDTWEILTANETPVLPPAPSDPHDSILWNTFKKPKQTSRFSL